MPHLLLEKSKQWNFDIAGTEFHHSLTLFLDFEVSEAEIHHTDLDRVPVGCLCGQCCYGGNIWYRDHRLVEVPIPGDSPTSNDIWHVSVGVVYFL